LRAIRIEQTRFVLYLLTELLCQPAVYHYHYMVKNWNIIQLIQPEILKVWLKQFLKLPLLLSLVICLNYPSYSKVKCSSQSQSHYKEVTRWEISMKNIWDLAGFGLAILKKSFGPSSNTSRLEAHVSFFRLLMKGIFCPYVLWPFDKKLIF
jgi:hypothetical protein